MTTADTIFFISGSIAAFISGVYLFIQAIKNKRETWLLLLISLTEIWSGLVYALVLFGVFPYIGYGPYIRPVTFIEFFAPTFIWIMITQSGKGTSKYGIRH